ncbi:MAG: hypothetical protein VYB34_14705 [Planctomycetota bacterium]|nr:hypothetical protein [Planctomycetota bacterium]
MKKPADKETGRRRPAARPLLPGPLVLLFIVLAGLPGRDADAAPPYVPTAKETEQIRRKLDKLRERLDKLWKKAAVIRIPEDRFLDAEIYAKATEWLLRYPEEFYDKSYVQKALKVLETGLARATALEAGKPGWLRTTGRLARAYRSRIDGSVQPYGLVIPKGYDGKTPLRLDLVLHGRNGRLSEVSFLAKHDSPAPPTRKHFELHVFGRTNNAYRWAGEVDIYEALASVERQYRIDPARIVLRGFSMGGAGAWHIGLHNPGRWAAVEAGAGFSDTIRYARLKEVPPYHRKALHIYDAVDYSLNAFNVPVVGYGGEIDKQLQASVNIREALQSGGFLFKKDGLNWKLDRIPPAGEAGLRAVFLVGPKTAHRFHPESRKRSAAFIRKHLSARQAEPDELRFVTYTTRYNRCRWLRVEGLKKHLERAEVHAIYRKEKDLLIVTTTNVSRLSLAPPWKISGVEIDGQRPALERTGAEKPLNFQLVEGRWLPGLLSNPGGRSLEKKHGLQGPIDDAFMSSFLCVRPTGKPMHPKAHAGALQELERLQREFPKWLRADVRTVEDRKARLENAGTNLILFGDPGSNSLIAEFIAEFPAVLEWDRERLKVAGTGPFAPGSHLPMLIYPNPKDPEHYVVINSGHSFGAREFRGTNAYLFPRRGDFAVLELGGKPGVKQKLRLAGFFDGSWTP